MKIEVIKNLRARGPWVELRKAEVVFVGAFAGEKYLIDLEPTGGITRVVRKQL